VKGRTRGLPIIASLALFVAGLLLYPFEELVVPAWTVQLVDPSGAPVPHVRIRQVWQNYSTEIDSHQDESVTDQDGYVTFPERGERSNLLERAFVGFHNLRLGVHGSWGPKSFVFALAGGDMMSTDGNYNGVGIPPPRIVLKPMSDFARPKDPEPIVK